MNKITNRTLFLVLLCIPFLSYSMNDEKYPEDEYGKGWARNSCDQLINEEIRTWDESWKGKKACIKMQNEEFEVPLCVYSRMQHGCSERSKVKRAIEGRKIEKANEEVLPEKKVLDVTEHIHSFFPYATSYDIGIILKYVEKPMHFYSNGDEIPHDRLLKKKLRTLACQLGLKDFKKWVTYTFCKRPGSFPGNFIGASCGSEYKTVEVDRTTYKRIRKCMKLENPLKKAVTKFETLPRIIDPCWLSTGMNYFRNEIDIRDFLKEKVPTSNQWYEQIFLNYLEDRKNFKLPLDFYNYSKYGNLDDWKTLLGIANIFKEKELQQLCVNGMKHHSLKAFFNELGLY